jgi:putative membrane-bound dehydrogenase-like protein
MMKRFLLATAAAMLFFSCSEKDTADERSAEASLADLKVYDGLKVRLFASEPTFSNPTNIAVDSRGRVWVCEAYNYRNDLNPKNPVRKEGDRIMILEDTDGDGVSDKSKMFYQGTDVNAALGICVLGKKVFVSCSPNVFVFTDENGDDIPDKKEVLFTGIQGEQHDHGMHTFTFGPDGRLYFNMGNAGKLLLDAKGDTVTDVHGRKIAAVGKPFYEGLALRCEPDGSNVEVLGHNFRNNYELAVDPFGTVWQSDNDDDGNKGTRINYVMEQGNFGYTDELTGAGWARRRTNMEKEIPFRHWHLNDPGVVPNVLQTGSGSPAGITMYEGTMLPADFQGQMIHAEAGHNVVRAYPVDKDGAGYKGRIVNLLEGQKDQWFRPVDVTVAPDGSVFVADWYDPGVGGHQAGDLNRGRIYRITASKTGYTRLTVDRATPEGAVEALLNPNLDVRYQGWTALASFGTDAEDALRRLWTSANPRHRAQALWLLSRIESKRDQYLAEAIEDADPDIRITALRASRQLKHRVLDLVQKVSQDKSAQVRREAILSLYGNGSKEAASLWTTLAMQYDGKDRWYLEALGIGAHRNWEQYFAAWREKVGKDWSTPANRDIVWRSRSREALPLLAELIRSSPEEEMMRYFRAFDFHRDPLKQQVLAKLAVGSENLKVLYALKHMDPRNFKITPGLKTTLTRVMDQYRGRLEFVELASSFNLREKSEALLAMAIQYPDSAAGKEAAKVLLNWDRMDLMQNVFDKNEKDQSQALVKALWPHMYDRKAMRLMETLLKDTAKNIEIRRLAVRTFAGPWESEDRLLELARENQIPAELHTAAAGVFQTAWRSNIREDGTRLLKLPGSKEGKSLPTIGVLAERSGKQELGKNIFKNVCSNCHRVDNDGVNFGPDLSEIGDKLSKEAMYTAILYPDQGISFGYEAYSFKLKNGSTAFGRIISETDEKIDLQYINTQQTINKADVVSRVKLENSLMPSNLNTMMTETELVDLVEYLSGLRKKDKSLTSR